MLGERLVALGALALAAGGCALVANYDFGKWGQDTRDGGAGGTGTASSAASGTIVASGTSTGPSTSAGTGMTTSASSSSGGKECTGNCVTLPTGWAGPVVIELGTSACPAAFPTALPIQVAQEILPPQPSWCGCTCDAPIDCTSGTLTVYSAASCTGSTSTYPVSNTCIQAISSVSASFKPTFNPATPCKAAPTIGIPGLQPQTATVCETPETCAGGLGCVPSGAKYCVSSPGALPCPAGFPTQYLLDPKGGFHDGRTCSPACACGPWLQAGCIGGADFWDQGACTGAQLGVPASGVCQPTAGYAGITANVALQVTGSCAPNTPAPAGSVTADSPTTICCQ